MHLPRFSGALFLALVLSVGSSPSGMSYNARDIKSDASFFKDESCRELREQIKAKDLALFRSELLRSVARGLLEGNYDTTYRAASYPAYPSPQAQ